MDSPHGDLEKQSTEPKHERTYNLCWADDKIDQHLISYPNLLNSAPGFIYWKDKQGHYLGCNSNWARALGFHDSTPIYGKSDYDLLPIDSALMLTRSDKQVLSQVTDCLVVQEQVTFKDGRQTTLFSMKKSIVDKDNNVIGIMINSIDISSLEAQQRSLLEKKEQAEQADQLKTMFIRDVEHDIRTPLSGIWSMLDIWHHEESDEEKRQILSEMCHALWQLMGYCDDLLDFTRIEHGTIPLAQHNLSLSEILHNVITMQKFSASQKNIKLNMNYDQNIPPLMRGDPYRLTRIIINLVNNAIKFTSSGTITLSAARADQHNTPTDSVTVRFVIQDSGVGISEAKQRDLREIFAAPDQNENGLYLGPALGLRIVSRYIAELNGQVSLNSLPQQGTTFTFTLPFGVAT